MSDLDLLRLYVRDRDNTAFSRLVARHVDLVYSAARRQVRATHLAEEVTQSVFTEVARRPPQLEPDQPLSAWLYVVTRRTAIDVVRSEARRRDRETTAAEITALHTQSESWSQVEASIDEAMAALNDNERSAIILRFFQNLSLREVGETLGVSEDTAQKRVSRALDRLREFFIHRRIAVSGTTFAAILSAHAVQAAPAGLIATIAASITALPLAATTAVSMQLAMTITQKIGLTVAAVVLAGGALYELTEMSRQRNGLAALQQRSDAALVESGKLTRENNELSRRLQVARSELSRPAPHSADPTIDAEIAAWLGRIARLRELMKQRPELAIPEMELLTDRDWFKAARDAEFGNDEQIRTSLSAVRNAARQKMLEPLKAALIQFVDANHGQLPVDIAQLTPFVAPSISPAILARYEMSWTGKIGAVPSDAWLIDERSPIDEEHDLRVFVSIGERGTTEFTAVRPQDLRLAVRTYAAANSGALPGKPADLLPYFATPLSPVKQKFFVEQQKTDFSPGGLQKFLRPE